LHHLISLPLISIGNVEDSPHIPRSGGDLLCQLKQDVYNRHARLEGRVLAHTYPVVERKDAQEEKEERESYFSQLRDFRWQRQFLHMGLEFFELRSPKLIVRIALSILTVEDRHDGHRNLLVVLSENGDNYVGVVSERVGVDQNREEQDLMRLLASRVA
jgi:hypothetical protein